MSSSSCVDARRRSTAMPTLTSARVDVDELGDEARALLELDEPDRQRVVERRDLRVVRSTT